MQSIFEICGKPIKPLISEAELQQRVYELGQTIYQDYRDKDLVMVGVLRGAYMFLTDLARHIQMPLTIDFLGVSSYGPRKTSSGVVRLTSDLSCSVVGRDVLIVEDIIDTGLTMNYLKDNFCTRKPNSVRVCSLLKKPDCIIQPIHIDYLGFEIEDRFVIGYGLDYKEKYRNLPYIGVVEGIEDDD